MQTFYINTQERLLGMAMNRNEAITYLKELLSQCNDMSPASVSFENPKNSDSVGYRIHIKGKIYASDMQKVREIAKKYSLAVKEEVDGVVVYRLR